MKKAYVDKKDNAMFYVYVLDGSKSSAVYYHRINANSGKVEDVCAATFYKTDTNADEVDKLVQQFKEGFEKLLTAQN